MDPHLARFCFKVFIRSSLHLRGQETFSAFYLEMNGVGIERQMQHYVTRIKKIHKIFHHVTEISLPYPQKKE